MSATSPGRDPHFHKTRWLYKKDGRDVGPFRPHELQELLIGRQIAGSTPVRDLTTPDWKALSQIPAFAEILAHAQTKLAHADEDRKIERQAAGHKTRRIVPAIAVAVVALGALGAGGFYAWQQYQSGAARVPSGISTELVRQLELKPLPERAYLNGAGPIDWAEETVAIREGKRGVARPAAPKPKRRPVASSATPAGPRAVGADDLADEPVGEATEFDFTAGGAEGRELGIGEEAMVRQTAANKLVLCAQAEADRSDGFPGTTVSFALLPSGHVGKIRLGKNGSASGAFQACVNASLGSIKVEPFAGTPLGFKVPLNVGR